MFQASKVYVLYFIIKNFPLEINGKYFDLNYYFSLILKIQILI